MSVPRTFLWAGLLRPTYLKKTLTHDKELIQQQIPADQTHPCLDERVENSHSSRGITKRQIDKIPFKHQL